MQLSAQIVRVTKQLEEAMEIAGVNRKSLAKRLNKSKGWVTQLLDGDKNKTIRTIAYAFSVLGAQFETGFTFRDDAQITEPMITFVWYNDAASNLWQLPVAAQPTIRVENDPGSQWGEFSTLGLRTSMPATETSTRSLSI